MVEAATGSLSIAGVIAGYGSGDILVGVDLEVERGRVTCVIGPNGAGKSTVLKVVSGLIRPRAGSVAVRRRASSPAGRPGGSSIGASCTSPRSGASSRP